MEHISNQESQQESRAEFSPELNKRIVDNIIEKTSESDLSQEHLDEIQRELERPNSPVFKATLEAESQKINLRKFVALAMVTLSPFLAKANTSESPETLTSSAAKEVTLDTDARAEDGEIISYEKASRLSSETEPEEINPTSEEKSIKRMESKIDFEIAKTDINQADLEALNYEVAQFIESFDSEDLEKIKNGSMIVVVSAGSSPEIIKAPIETSMGSVTNNYELSQMRAEVYVEKVLAALQEKGINNPITITDIAEVPGLEPGVSENGERFASVTALELTNENLVQMADTIILDRSGSMKDDVAELESANQLAEQGAQLVTLETHKGKNGEILEMYFSSMQDQVHKAKPGDVIVMIGDEKSDDGHQFKTAEERSENYRKMFLDIKQQAEEKGLTLLVKRNNPDNPDDSIIGDFTTSGMMMTLGSDDQESYKRHKHYLDTKA
mgnify:CR=1 FL=1